MGEVGEVGEVGEFQLKPHHPPQRARSDHPNTLTPQHPNTQVGNKKN